MSKRKKRKDKNHKRKKPNPPASAPVPARRADAPAKRGYQVDRSTGPVGRVYPPLAARQAIIAEIRSGPETERSAADWYTLGSLLVYQGCLDEDDGLLN